jgi:hypothetical protein
VLIGTQRATGTIRQLNFGYLVLLLSVSLISLSVFTPARAATNRSPKWMSDAATAVHHYEALLATFSILLWHFYMGIFDPLVYPMDTAWPNGKAPADHYRHSRAEYLHVLERAH